MSLQADRQHSARVLWALPGGPHDRTVARLKLALPIVGFVAAIFFVVAPFATRNEVSFVLDKNQVDVASERLRVREALYRGQDSNGRPFSLRAGSAVQKTSLDPTVDMRNLSARILMSDGPAVLAADHGVYNLETENVGIVGPVQFQAAGGYRLVTRDVGINLKTRRLRSIGRVDGRMPIGTFGADHLEADLAARTVTLNGRASLRIEQNGLRGQK